MKKESIKAYSYRISQASPTELIVIMYDMASEYITDAQEAAANGNRKEFCNNILYAKRVVDSLLTSLDMKYEIAEELAAEYIFINKILVKNISSGEASDLDIIKRMIMLLRDSFAQISKQDNSGPVMQNAEQVYAGFTYSSSGNSNEFSSSSGGSRGYRV